VIYAVSLLLAMTEETIPTFTDLPWFTGQLDFLYSAIIAKFYLHELISLSVWRLIDLIALYICPSASKFL
jgi:hypothetical protein